ncbi:UNVERIFIED_CONTAM: hypothetical protein FKN15_057594 [Acipenser sinensis]
MEPVATTEKSSNKVSTLHKDEAFSSSSQDINGFSTSSPCSFSVQSKTLQSKTLLNSYYSVSPDPAPPPAAALGKQFKTAFFIINVNLQNHSK